MSDVPSSIFQTGSTLNLSQGFEKFDKQQGGIQSAAAPQAQKKLPAVTPEDASKKYAGPTTKPTSAKELYVSSELARDPEYQRQIKGLGRNGTAEQQQAILAQRTAHHANYWDNVMVPDQKAEFSNKAVEKGQLEKSQGVNTSRLDPFKAQQGADYRAPGDKRTDQDMANAALKENNSAGEVQDRRTSAGLTAGTTPAEIAQNRAVLQGLADAKTNRGQGANPMIGRVTGAETNSGSGGNVTTTRYSGPTPTADQKTIAAASQAGNAAVVANNAEEYQGNSNNKVMSGAEFNAMQDRMATANNPAQHTNDQKVFTSFVPDSSGGAGQYKIQGSSNNVPGYTTPSTIAGSQPGTINGMPGQQAIAEQKATNEAQAASIAGAATPPATASAAPAAAPDYQGPQVSAAKPSAVLNGPQDAGKPSTTIDGPQAKEAEDPTLAARKKAANENTSNQYAGPQPNQPEPKS